MAAPSEPAFAEIQRRLDAIVSSEGVRLLWAAESGSRAWGFPSPDSDYDVRFVYARPLDDYLRLSPKRDVIETPFDGVYDVNGWDILKALRLMTQGNAVLHEWLVSPIVYRRDEAFAAQMMPLAEAWREALGSVHHYYGLLRRQKARFLDGREQVNLKKYFYVIRPAVALHWIRENGALPPMSLPELLQRVSLPEDVGAALETLRLKKLSASELGAGSRIPALDAYIEEHAQWGFAHKDKADPPREGLFARTDDLFREIVRRLEP